ncbi:MerR [Saccharopolyspora sp. NFXS83]|uniref:MerR n=1 Tax=Saccharopolyspora sp. NFXS83 TaxID=2993560 RepID=UPI00224B8B2D|nr:MerR [Saccharopolyspora sp. NFXS83]MCX2732527.1 MerR [Saccharopolyspora sp. NFXS83]
MSAEQLSSYRVHVSREDRSWVAHVQGLPAGATEVDHLEELDLEVRDLIAGLADREPDSFRIDWRYLQGDVEYTRPVEELRHWAAESKQAAANAERARREIITTLRSAGLSQRAIAEVIGTSHQRVAQLMAEAS